MKKLVALAAMLTAFTQSPILFAADSTNARPRNLWRTLFSCCCSAETADQAAAFIETVQGALEAILEANPGAVREIYLNLKKAEYKISEATLTLLHDHGFVDDRYHFRKDWKKHTKELLTHNGIPGGVDGFHLVQCVADLLAKHADEVENILGVGAGTITMPASTIKLLASQYGLTREALPGIIKEINKQKEPHRGFAVGPSFRVLGAAEITPGTRSELFAK